MLQSIILIIKNVEINKKIKTIDFKRPLTISQTVLIETVM